MRSLVDSTRVCRKEFVSLSLPPARVSAVRSHCLVQLILLCRGVNTITITTVMSMEFPIFFPQYADYFRYQARSNNSTICDSEGTIGLFCGLPDSIASAAIFGRMARNRSASPPQQ